MSQPTGIPITNTHLLRAAMLFMVLGVIGPGLFQLQPPQWFGAPAAGPDGALTAAAPSRPAPKTFTLPDADPPANITSPALTTGDDRADAVPPGTQVAAADDLDPGSLDTGSLETDGPAIESRPPVSLPDVDEDSPAVTAAAPNIPAAPATPAVPAAEQVASVSGDVANDMPDALASRTPDATSEVIPEVIPEAPPERPAVAARQSRPVTPPETPQDDIQNSIQGNTQDNIKGTDAPAPTQTASLSPRTTAMPAPPASSAPPTRPTATRPTSTGPKIVPRDLAKNIPQSHLGLPVKRQKESFIGITLPLILAANEEISQRRSAITRAVSRGDEATLYRWAQLYRVKIEGRPLAEIQKELLLRADYVPVSLALAQAAIESGWGTSRFALQGNALFGQWAWQRDAGLKPARASNSNAVVRSFPNLFGSVRAYMHNLNTHPRYAAFRARRHLLRGRTQSDLGYQLSNFLDGYAEIGEAYVAKLKTLIRTNDLGQFEAARLR